MKLGMVNYMGLKVGSSVVHAVTGHDPCLNGAYCKKNSGAAIAMSIEAADQADESEMTDTSSIAGAAPYESMSSSFLSPPVQSSSTRSLTTLPSPLPSLCAAPRSPLVFTYYTKQSSTPQEDTDSCFHDLTTQDTQWSSALCQKSNLDSSQLMSRLLHNQHEIDQLTKELEDSRPFHHHRISSRHHHSSYKQDYDSDSSEGSEDSSDEEPSDEELAPDLSSDEDSRSRHHLRSDSFDGCGRDHHHHHHHRAREAHHHSSHDHHHRR